MSRPPCMVVTDLWPIGLILLLQSPSLQSSNDNTRACTASATKAQRFSPETAYGGKSRGGAGAGDNFSGVSRRGIRMTFSLQWQGFGKFRFILTRNLYILTTRDFSPCEENFRCFLAGASLVTHFSSPMMLKCYCINKSYKRPLPPDSISI